MDKIKVEIGDYVTYSFGINKDVVYIYIADQPHSIALCQDMYGQRWPFSRAALVKATLEQIAKYLQDKPKEPNNGLKG